MADVIKLPGPCWSDRGEAPYRESEEINCDVPERPAQRAARRPWFSDRWRAFHYEEPGRACDTLTLRLHHQLRRRRL